MDEAREMVWISVPFAAGTAAGICVTGTTWWDIGAMQFCSAAALTAAALSLALSAKYGKRFAIALAFLFSGLFGAMLSPASGHLGGEGTGIAARTCGSLRSLIDSIPYSDKAAPAMVKALLTGDRSSLSRETVSIFRKSGAAHILALSGLHLGFIYLIVRKSFSITGNSPMAARVRCACIISSAGFYTLMTGAGPSIVRAFLYITIRELSGLDAQRRLSAQRTLMLCLTVQCAVTPRVVTTLGFQLSYLAMCGITFILPYFQSWYPNAEGRFAVYDPLRRIWNGAALAISCQIFTAPLVWFKFHSFPKHFLITNLFAMPLTSLTMALSIATVALSGLGICPTILVEADERLISILTGVLRVIEGM